MVTLCRGSLTRKTFSEIGHLNQDVASQLLVCQASGMRLGSTIFSLQSFGQGSGQRISRRQYAPTNSSFESQKIAFPLRQEETEKQVVEEYRKMGISYVKSS
jgi:hypothetical protein